MDRLYIYDMEWSPMVDTVLNWERWVGPDMG